MKQHKGIREQIDFDASRDKQDEELYELLFEQLEKEKEITIHPSFSSTVMDKLKAKHKKEARKDTIMFALAITGVLFFSFMTLQVISSFGKSESFVSIGMFMPVFALAALLVTFQLLDHNLIRKKRIKQHLGI
ncbi:hypothetical protein [Roseivirga sp. E12]|uniref:hypothetical protein n=1 Tax=Roseivirga sp. E12 TaxID=2819237 RepID=UPI001ABCB169|nr:hypothetical protein [Roseivirga sp. E12]MBO3697476.1 hypothetical protein [Roseivirga sp. E12]